MKKNILIFFAICCLINSSCTKVLLYTYGVRNPRIENSESIKSYLFSQRVDTTNLYALKDTATLDEFYESGIGTPEIKFYDKNGYLMLYRDDKKCNAQNDSLINFLNPLNVVKVDSSENINNYINKLRRLNGEKVNINDFRQYDYYLIVYWAKWLGKVNSVKLIDWENSLKDKNGIKLKTIKVTTDYMRFWQIDKRKMSKIYGLKTKTKQKSNHQ